MVYTIHLEATASGEAVRAALAHAPREEVALVFPWGKPCALSDARQLEALYEACAAQDMALVIVGGDQQLRAHAVAAGFAAATSIEEWETSKHRAIRARREAAGARRRGADRAGWGAPAMHLVTVARWEAAERDATNLFTLDGEDPPEYVTDLLARERTEQEERHATVPTVPLQRGRPTRVLSETVRDRREAEALERAQQLFEERLTETIRQSSGPIAPPMGAGESGGQQSGADS